MRIAEMLGGAAHRGDAVLVEGDRRVIEDLLEIVSQADLLRDRLDAFVQRRVHFAQRRVDRMAELAGHEHFAGNHVARIGVGVEHADRRDAERRLREADAVDELDDARRAEQRVLAARHRRRAGMALEAGQRFRTSAGPGHG